MCHVKPVIKEMGDSKVCVRVCVCVCVCVWDREREREKSEVEYFKWCHTQYTDGQYHNNYF